jgi:hypothetical protein
MHLLLPIKKEGKREGFIAQHQSLTCASELFVHIIKGTYVLLRKGKGSPPRCLQYFPSRNKHFISLSLKKPPKSKKEKKRGRRKKEFGPFTPLALGHRGV